MINYSNKYIYSPDLDVSDDFNENLNIAISFLENKKYPRVLKELVDPELSEKNITDKKIFKKSQELGFISKSTIPGFINVLPKCKVMERIVEDINSKHLKALNSVEISFPSVFDNSLQEIKSLTGSYEKESRILKLESLSIPSSMSYAADPGLFLWLKNRVVDSKKLPYSIFSQTQVFRNFRSGETGKFQTLREFPMPDLHILCNINKAYRSFVKNLILSKKHLDFFIQNENYTLSIDISKKLYDKYKSKIIRLSKVLNIYILVNVLVKKPRYYDIKTGFMVGAAKTPMMFYNMQWDEENPKRFNIRSSSNDDIVILHGTLLHSWYRMLPVFLNECLEKGEKYALPLCIAPLQVAIIYKFSKYKMLAKSISRYLEERNVRCSIYLSTKKIKKQIEKNLIPYSIWIERSEKYYVHNNISNDKYEIDIFLNKYKELFKDTSTKNFSRYDLDSVFL